MADTPTDVLVGAYPDIDAATKDFDALAKLVEDKKVKMEAAILITHAEDGSVTVAQTADHRGRKGVEWGGARGRPGRSGRAAAARGHGRRARSPAA